ncbi:MAG: hypothetical protein AAF664_11175, partial [Planctomycetota bacterium]
MSEMGPKHHLVSVIEPSAENLVGAWMQWNSLKDDASVSGQTLGVVARNSQETADILAFSSQLQMRAMSCIPHLSNPFMNRWSIFDADPELLDRPSLLLADWDVIRTASDGNQEPWPVVAEDRLGARKNPTFLYQSLASTIRDYHLDAPVDLHGNLAESINGGVMLASGETTTRVREKHRLWFSRVSAITSPQAWQLEQCTLSMAAAEVGVHPLPNQWNSTAASNEKDARIQLFHYNDGDERTRRLKRGLLRSGYVTSILDDLAVQFPKTVDEFRRIYEKV